MLLMTLFAVLFSVMRTMGAHVETFAVISTMVAAVAIGQILLFGGRYPRAASIWVGAGVFPLQIIALCVWESFEYTHASLTPDGLVCLLPFSIPVGAGFGYLTGGMVGGVFLILDALAQWQQSRRDAAEAAEPPEPTGVVQKGGDQESGASAPKGS